MEPGVSENLSEQQTQLGLKMVIRDGIAAQIMGVLTGGAFLIAFAVKLGASNTVIGLLAAIGPLSQLLQLPAIFLVEKVRRRRAIVVITAGIARFSWIGIALLPLILGPKLGLGALLGILVFASALGAFSGCSWNSWMRDLIPESKLGSFFSKRLQLMVGAGIVVSFLAAVYLDFFKKYFPESEVLGYSILFLLGVAAGLLGVYFLWRTPEPKMPTQVTKQKILPLLWGPFKDENFRKLMAFMCSWNFAVNLAGPFFMVYMLKRLGMSMSFIIALSILSQITNFLFLKLWGRYTDHYSNKSVLMVCGPLFILSILAWTFTTMPEKYALTIPLIIAIHAVMGIAGAGVSLASGNISMKLAPKGQATAYLATNTITNSIAAGISPIIGGKTADFFAARQLEWTLKYTAPSGEFILPTLDLQQWDFFFAIAFVIGLYSIHRLSMVREVGEVEEKVIVNQLMSEAKDQVRILSSVEGVRQVVSFPLYAIRNTAEKMLGNNKKTNDIQTDVYETE